MLLPVAQLYIPKPCNQQVMMSAIFDSAADVAQQQDNKRLHNANWKKSLRHKQRLGVLNDGGVQVLAFYRSRASNVSVAFGKTLDTRLHTLPAEERQKFDAAVVVIQHTLSDMPECPAKDSKVAICGAAHNRLSRTHQRQKYQHLSCPARGLGKQHPAQGQTWL